jgi:TolB protein
VHRVLACLLFLAGALALPASPRAAAPPREAPPAPVRRLTTDSSFKQHLQWSPDSLRLLMTRIHKGQMGLWTVKLDGTALEPLLVPTPTSPHFDGHWSSDGKKVVFVLDILQGSDGKLQINTCTADGKDSKVLIPHQAFEESPRCSPDGTRVAWVSTRHGNQEVYSVKSDGSDLRRLTNDVALDNAPSWSPDGTQIAFASARSGNFEIYVMKADGSEVRRLSRHLALDYWPAWSPDGKSIAFTSNRDGNYEIYLMNADGSRLRNLTRHPGQDNFAAFSPDGKQLAFVSNRDGGHDIYVMDLK